MTDYTSKIRNGAERALIRGEVVYIDTKAGRGKGGYLSCRLEKPGPNALKGLTLGSARVGEIVEVKHLGVEP